MLRKIALLLALTLWSSTSLLLPKEASAQTALSRAVIESLRNQVRLIPKNQSARPARPSDAMTPGDALATAKASTAQLRFNDGSLARLGEQAVFSFSPGTRTFGLSNGTALVLIPPGRGTTRVRTPNAAAGIRGSALFVRYIPETDTTIVGALTNSGIEVFNEAASQRQELKAGNMAVIVKNRIEKVYEFDLKTFYQTSELVSGLNLTKSESTPNSDPAIAQVQAETAEALQAQSPIAGAQIIENPSFVQLAASPSQEFPRVDRPITGDTPSSRPRNLDLPGNTIRNTIDVRTLLDGKQIRDNRPPSQVPGVPGGDDNRPGRSDRPDQGNNPPGPGGNGPNGGNGNGNTQGNNPPGPGGNGPNAGNGNGNTQGNNPPGSGVNGTDRGNSYCNTQGNNTSHPGTDVPNDGNVIGNSQGNNPPGPGGNGPNRGNGNGNTQGNNPPGPGGNGSNQGQVNSIIKSLNIPTILPEITP